jgi:glucose-1-phosphate thymidylyltransferase
VKGLILAGGHGTRLRPLTFTGNKHMIPIANEPMLFYGLRHLANGGLKEVGLVLGDAHEGIEEAVGDGRAFGLRVTYIHQGAPKGLAHAVACAREFLAEDPFVMYLGDNLLEEGTAPLIAQFRARPADAIIGVTAVENPSSYGVVEMRGETIVSIVEKPAQPKSNLALIGVYLFSPKIHAIIDSLSPSRRGELEITDAIWKLHEAGGRVAVRRVSGWWKDTGRPEDLLTANDLVLESWPVDRFRNEGNVSPEAKIQGHVAIGAGTVIDAGARLEGPLVIGTNSWIGSGSQIGPRVAIGDRCSVKGSTVRRSILMEGAELRGRMLVSDSIFGRNARVTCRSARMIPMECVMGDATQITF